MILAAGLGTRLRPWTLSHPKALVPVGGVPMLGRVLSRMESMGYDHIVVNVHHFARQIIEYISSRDNKAKVWISDESGRLLDTGGAILHARHFFRPEQSLLVHNVDICSNAALDELYDRHSASGHAATLVVSERESSRRLVFDNNGRLKGWTDLRNGAVRPSGLQLRPERDMALAFSGIYFLSPDAINRLADWATDDKFSIIDFLIDNCAELPFYAYKPEHLDIIDIGKPETLREANEVLPHLVLFV